MQPSKQFAFDKTFLKSFRRYLGAGDKLIQCVDPGKPYTNGGTVIFEVSVQNNNKRNK